MHIGHICSFGFFKSEVSSGSSKPNTRCDHDSPFQDPPFPLLELTQSEMEHPFFRSCLKYQTPGYIAYVPEMFRSYIKSTDLYQDNEDATMREARRFLWKGPLDERPAQLFRQCHPDAANKMDRLWEVLNDKDNMDRMEIYSKFFSTGEKDRLETLSDRSTRRFLFSVLFPVESRQKVLKLSKIALFVLIGISACFLAVKCNYK